MPAVMAFVAVLWVPFAGACNRGERELSPAPSATPAAVETPSAAPPASVPPVVPAPSASQSKPEPGTSTACATDADCRKFSDSCGACACRPLAKASPDPKCTAKRMACMVEPCLGQHVMCRKGNCVLGDPGDASTADAAATKDASTADTAAKGATSAAPPGSAAPKADAAKHE